MKVPLFVESLPLLFLALLRRLGAAVAVSSWGEGEVRWTAVADGRTPN